MTVTKTCLVVSLQNHFCLIFYLYSFESHFSSTDFEKQWLVRKSMFGFSYFRPAYILSGHNFLV